MPSRTIETKLRITGDKEYTDAIKSASNELKVLRSEMRADTAGMDGNTKSKEKNRKITENLKKQLEQQKKIVEANQKRLEEATKSGKASESQIATLTVKLNDSIAAMKKTEAAIHGVGKAGEDAGSKLSGGLMKNLEFNQAIEAFKNFSGIVTGVLGGIASTASGVVENVKAIVTEVSGAADSIVTLSQQSGLSIDTLNKLAYASAAGYDIDYTTFAGAAKKLKTSVGGAAFAGQEVTRDKRTGEIISMKDAGLFHGLNYVVDSEGNRRDATSEETMWNVLAYASQYYKMHGETEELDEALSQALGKSFTDFMPFFQDPNLLSAMIQEGVENGFVRDDEQTLKLASIDDTLQRINAITQSIKQLFVLLFADNFNEIGSNYGDLLKAVNDYENALLKGEDTSGAISEMQGAAGKLIESVFATIGTAFENLIKTLRDLASETDPETGEKTLLAKIAEGIVNFYDWCKETLPVEYENFKKTMEGVGGIVEKISTFLGLDQAKRSSQEWLSKNARAGMFAGSDEEAAGVVRAAAEALYDYEMGTNYNQNTESELLSSLLESVNGDREAYNDLLLAIRNFENGNGAEDLPSEWFESTWSNVNAATEQMTANTTAWKETLGEMRTQIGRISSEVRNGFNGISISVDGASFGTYVNNTVNSGLIPFLNA